MTSRLRKSLLVFFAGVLALALGFVCLGATTAKANGDLSVTMDKGALVRLQENSGLRFRATLENYDPDAVLEYGMVIVPKDYLTTYNITGNYVTEFDRLVSNGTIPTYINAKVLPTQVNGEWVIQHSIVNIMEGNYDRDFVGIGYVYDGTNYQYATPNDNERSIAYIASYALNELNYNQFLDDDAKELYTDNKALLENFVTTGVANVTNNFTPALNGLSELNAGEGFVLELNGVKNIKLDWRYSSSNTNVAMVSPTGEVTAYSNGTATVTAKCSGLYDSSVTLSVSGKQLDLGAYWGKGTSGKLWEKDGVDMGDEYALERLREYKDAGLRVYIPGLSASYVSGSTTWVGSNAKRLFDLCEQVGLKVLLLDQRLRNICNSDSLFRQFAHYGSEYNEETKVYEGGVYNETELIDYIKKNSWTGYYASHPAFYGFDLYDEPPHANVDVIERVGKVYRALRRAYPELYVHVCLLPMGSSGYASEEALNYYNSCLDQGLEYLMFDQYPLYYNQIAPNYIAMLKWRAEICKERGIDLKIATQTFKSKEASRDLDEADLYWLNNMALGFGAKNLYYYTYLTEVGHADYDGYTFINNQGEKTNTYYSMQKIMGEMKTLAPMALQFDYNAAALFTGSEGEGKNTHYENITSDTLTNINAVAVDYERTLVTELIKGENEYMYMVQNVADPNFTNDITFGEQTVTLTFTDDVKEIVVFRNGKDERVTLDGNTYTITQTAGQASFIFITKTALLSLGENTVNIGDILNKGTTVQWANEE